MQVKIKRVDKSISLPEYDDQAAGFDIPCRKKVTIKPKETAIIPGNIAIEIPPDHFLLLVPRSSTWYHLGLMMPHSVGIIDPFQQNFDREVLIQLYNPTEQAVTVNKGDKLVQGILVNFEQATIKEAKGEVKKFTTKKWRQNDQEKPKGFG